MTIKEFAEVTGLSAHTLRYYEKLGIIPPVPRDTNGIRNYSGVYLQRIQLVQQLKASGMKLENILTYLQTMGASKKAQKIRKDVLLKTKMDLMAKAVEIRSALEQVEKQLQDFGVVEPTAIPHLFRLDSNMRRAM